MADGNGATPDDSELDGRQPQLEDVSRNGVGGDVSDMMLQRDRQGTRFHAGKELSEGSGEPEIYLPRTRQSDEEIANTMRVLARRNRIVYGYTNIDEMLTWKYNARMGLNGMARAEIVAIATAERDFEKMNKGLGLGDRTAIARDIDRQEFADKK